MDNVTSVGSLLPPGVMRCNESRSCIGYDFSNLDLQGWWQPYNLSFITEYIDGSVTNSTADPHFGDDSKRVFDLWTFDNAYQLTNDVLALYDNNESEITGWEGLIGIIIWAAALGAKHLTTAVKQYLLDLFSVPLSTMLFITIFIWYYIKEITIPAVLGWIQYLIGLISVPLGNMLFITILIRYYIKVITIPTVLGWIRSLDPLTPLIYILTHPFADIMDVILISIYGFADVILLSIDGLGNLIIASVSLPFCPLFHDMCPKNIDWVDISDDFFTWQKIMDEIRDANEDF